MPSPILARADALMQRRRQNAEQDDVPVLTDAVGEDDDIPVLLDIETFDTGLASEPEPALEPENPIEEPVSAAPPIDAPPPPPPSLDAGVRDILAHELARRVEQRLAAELPRLIESTVRDFLAEQEMIAATQPRD
jgi:hypothetical protein